MKYKVLIIDDDESYVNSMAEILALRNYECYTSLHGLNVLELIEKYNIDILLLDLSIPGKNGLQILQEVVSQVEGIPVIMISGQGEIRHAVDAIKKGAFDFIEKGEPIEKVFKVMENALQKRKYLVLRREVGSNIHANGRIIGESMYTQHLNEIIQKIAVTNMDVLIMGESGTGKELVARQIHALSNRSKKPFVALNSANFNPNLIESELFGHTRGAFTGADQEKKGKIFESDGGTLFLDEIGELPYMLQGRLLRVIETREAVPVGGTTPRKSDFRLVAATNKDIPQMVQEKKFREDLYYRIANYIIRIPPLRERKEDIIPIFYYYLVLLGEKYKEDIPEIKPDVEQLLLEYPWPGNVRELKSFAENIVIFFEGKILDMDSLRKVLEGALIHHPIARFINNPY